MYLITKWFGTFLLDENGIKDKILFPKNIKSISSRLLLIKKGEILPEEKKISQDLKDLIVNDERLKKFGVYKPNEPFFKKFEIDSEEFGFSSDLLQKAMIIVTEKKIDEELSSEDLQIIHMINILDDFIQISNLLSERLENWLLISAPKEKIQPLKNTIYTIDIEIKSLEKIIENEMEKVAPNVTRIVGSLIGARLISLSGGMKRLAMLPSSTIQILGAEKALFRFKKEGGKPPKHGVIFQHAYINKSNKNVRGKIARSVAAKISIAAKADAFTKRDISNELIKNLNKRINEIKHQ